MEYSGKNQGISSLIRDFPLGLLSVNVVAILSNFAGRNRSLLDSRSQPMNTRSQRGTEVRYLIGSQRGLVFDPTLRGLSVQYCQLSGFPAQSCRFKFLFSGDVLEI